MTTNKTPLTIQDPRGQICNEELKYVSKQSFWGKNTKKILGKNFLIDEEIEEQNQNSQNLFFFDFSKL